MTARSDSSGDAVLTAGYRVLLDALPDPVLLIDDSGRAVWLNQRAEHLAASLARTADGVDVAGEPLTLLDALLPENATAASVIEHVRNVVEGTSPQFEQHWPIQTGGRRGAVHLSATRVEIEGLTRTLLVLRKSDPDDWVDQITIGLFHADANGNWMAVNDCACRFIGLDVDEAIHDGWLRAVDSADRHRVFESWMYAVREGNEFQASFCFRHGDESRVHVTLEAAPRRTPGGEIIGFVGVLKPSDRLIKDPGADSPSSIYQRIVETTDEGVWVLHPDGRTKFGNARVAELLGCDLTTLATASIFDFVDTDWREKIHESLDRSAHGICERQEVCLVRQDGRRLWVEMVTSPLTNSHGDFIAEVAVIKDITERKQAEEAIRRTQLDLGLKLEERSMELSSAIENLRVEILGRARAEEALRQSNDRYRSLLQTIPHGIRENDLQGRITYCNSAFARMHGGETGDFLGRFVWEMIASKAEREPIRGLFPHTPSRQAPPGSYVTQSRTRTGQLIDVQVDWDYRLEESGEITGFIAMVTDITTRRRVEAALRESEERYRTLVETMREGIIVTNAECRNTYANDQVLEMLGLPREQVIGQRVDDLFDGEERQIVQEQIEKRRLGDSTPYELLFPVKPDGSRAWALISPQPLFDEQGQFAGSMAVVTDITSRKMAEEKLRLFQAIVENSSEAITVNDVGGHTIYINPAHEKLFGRTLEQASKCTASDYHPAEADAMIRHDILPTLAQHDSWTGEIDTFDANGRRFPIWQRLDTVSDVTGKTLFTFGLMHDVTEHRCMEDALRQTQVDLEHRVRHRTAELEAINDVLTEEICERNSMEHALRASERQHRLITDNVPGLICYVDSSRIYRFVNRSYQEWFGLSRSEIVGRGVKDVLGGLAYETIREHITSALNGNRVTFEMEVPYPHRGPRWVSATYVPDFDHDGNVLGFYALATDINDQKNVERSLREESGFISLVMDTARSLVVVLDRGGRIVRFNRACEELTGFSFDEVGRQFIWEALLHPDKREQCREQIRAMADGSPIDHIENEWITRDGLVHQITWTVSSRNGDDGRIKFIVGIGEVSDKSSDADHTIEERLVRQELLTRLSQETVPEDGLAGLFENVSRLVAHALNVKSVQIYRVQPEDERGQWQAGFGETVNQPPQIDSSTFVGQALDSEEGLVIAPDLNDTPTPDPYLVQLNFESGAAVVLEDGEIERHILVAFGGKEHTFSKEDREFLQDTATILQHTLQHYRSRKQLEAERQRLQDAECLTQTGHWEWDVQTNELLWSGQMCRTFGLDADHWHGRYEEFVRRIHPDDRDRILQAMDAAAFDDQIFACDYRIIQEDGGVRQVHSRGLVSRDDRGQPLRVFGTIWDATEATRALGSHDCSSDSFTDHQRHEIVMSRVVEGISSKAGEAFFGVLVEHLAEALGVNCAMVGELIPGDRSRVRVKAIWSRGTLHKLFEYSTNGTPCAKVAAGSVCFHPHSLQELFPSCEFLQMVDAESFLGTPIHDSSGEHVGMLIVMDTKPMDHRELNESILRIFGVRAGVEIERTRGEESLKTGRESFRRLAVSRQNLLDELNHRVKNNLTGLLSLVSMMRDQRGGTLSFADAIHNRLLAMTTIHEIIAASGWQSVDLLALTDQLAGVFDAGSNRIHRLTLGGPSIEIVPRQAGPLAIILQELLTNCLKHGAHRQPNAGVSLTWRILDAGEDDRSVLLEIVWKETGVSNVTPPDDDYPGLGLRLIEGFARFEMGGRAEFHFDPDGFRCILRCAMDRVDLPVDAILLAEADESNPDHPE